MAQELIIMSGLRYLYTLSKCAECLKFCINWQKNSLENFNFPLLKIEICCPKMLDKVEILV